MDKDTRNAIERATQRARKLLEEDFAARLEGDFDVHPSGAIAAKGGAHLSARQAFQREKIVAAIEHKRAAGMSTAEAVADYLRDAAFTTLNRFVALKMLEARELVQQCITRGEQSSGYHEFCGMAPGLPLLPDSAGYRLYIESLFDELSTEVKVLFDRRDPASVLWPKRTTFEQLLEVLNAAELAGVWGEDETIGWVYQYFNSLEERQAMKDIKAGGSPAPRNSRELATRNQFFTPRYIVRFLTDNTLGRLWWEMRSGNTVLHEQCELLAVRPDAKPTARAKKDPRDIRIIDPACGSGHFLLYVFDLLLCIYDEAWADPDSPASEVTGTTLRSDFPSPDALHAAAPELIIRHNLFGVDIDPRCVQVASFALWLRAQRAWSELRVPRAARPHIEHSHVILAEPMPGDPKLVQEFANQVGHPVLATLFEKVVDAFKLAGDLGIVLRVERMLEDAIRDAERSTRQGNLFGAGADSREFWATAEDRLLEALARFAAGGHGRENERRRLFRHDSAHGLALLHAARTKFDVVLMNPPFGDPSGPSKDYIDDTYQDSRQDIFAVFVDRCVRDLAPSGLIGVISTEAGFFRRTLEPWRRNVLIPSSTVEVFAHLGDNVLDTAKVRVAAYALRTPAGVATSTYIRAFLGSRESRESLVCKAIGSLRGGKLHPAISVTPQSEFESLPYGVFGYWFSQELRDVFRVNRTLESYACARRGMSTGDDFRFLRLRWETPVASKLEWEWRPFAKGGEYSPYYDDIHLTCQWNIKRNSIHGYVGRPGREGAVPEAVDYYFRPGLTYPRRTNKRFAPRILPRGCALGDKGPAIVDINGNAWALAALLNSRVLGYLISVGTGVAEATDVSNSYEVGLVQRLPVPRQAAGDTTLSEYGKIAWNAQAESNLREETAFVFASPAAPCALGASLRETWEGVVGSARKCTAEYIETQIKVDRRTCELYDLTDSDWREIEREIGDIHRPDLQIHEHAYRGWVESVISFLVGCAFGRWDPSRLTTAVTLNSERAFAQPTIHANERGDGPAILIEDAGHPLDLVIRCSRELESVIGDAAHRLLAEIATALGYEDLRGYFREEFFAAHLRVYTKSRRTAPIFIPLATASRRYCLWLYLHRLGRDTLFTAHSDYVKTKLRFEEDRLTSLQSEGGTGAAARKHLAAQHGFVEELRVLAEEVRRVAPLWKPDIADGVLVSFAPLWRLVPHEKAWQKELKATWDALCDGKYDWAHLAMHLWPERVVPKCATDRSLAIAHGLENVFWLEGSDGKWSARKTPTRAVEELVRERISPAVKAALKSLLEAPVAAGGSKKSRKGKPHA